LFVAVMTAVPVAMLVVANPGGDVPEMTLSGEGPLATIFTGIALQLPPRFTSGATLRSMEYARLETAALAHVNDDY
jgi:hypothetical protein